MDKEQIIDMLGDLLCLADYELYDLLFDAEGEPRCEQIDLIHEMVACVEEYLE